jgi:hypothetical protein
MAHVHDRAPTDAFARKQAAVLVLKLVALSAAAIVAGGTFAIWRGYPPHDLSASAYVEMQQGAIQGLNLLFPLVGLVALLAATALAFLTHGRKRWFFVLAVVLMIVAALVTRFGNQPINALVVGWSPEAPPQGWEALRDRWWWLHLTRTFFACLSYLALALGCLLPSASRGAPRR